MSSSSSASTVIMARNNASLSNSQDLSSSTSSFSPSRQGSSHFSKVYKQASQLFLTRRLAEALSLLEPVVLVPAAVNGHGENDEDVTPKAQIASASSSQRIKIWSLYITVLNSILDLTDDEGKHEFGQKKFKEIGNQVRNGDIWESVVRDGYNGREAAVDAEVVYNLATLLLGQALDQKLTQQRLETYLAASPELDISGHLQQSPTRRSRRSGTNTPRDLSSRVKIVELFTLHVLPRNEEWEYARSFISNSDILDEERREAFLQTLEELKEVQEPEEQEPEEIIPEPIHEQQLSPEPQAEAVLPASNGFSSQTLNHKRSESEIDYGIDSPKRKPNGISANGSTQSPAPVSPSKPVAPKPIPSTTIPTPRPRASQTTSPRSKKVAKSSQPDALSQAKNVFRALQNLVSNMAGNLTGNPAAILKTLLFIVAFLSVIGRGQMRERLRRALGGSWEKVKGTIGMGVKVSYI